MLRNDHSDWLLLKRGDVWYEPIGSITSSRLKNGRSLDEPTLIASYGSEGPRPLLMLGDHRAGLRVALNRPASAKNLAVVGIHFYDHKGDPDSEDFESERDKGGAGIDWKSPGEGLLIEDCRFDNLSAGVIVGKSPWKGTPDDVLRNVRIRRCVATNAWSSHGHCQGFFVNAVTGLLLEENVLDHNGYCYETGDVPTWFNHNVYITIRCDLSRLRTDRRDRHNEPAVRTMDRGARQPTTDRRGPGPANAPLPHPGGDRRKLPSEGREKAFLQTKQTADQHQLRQVEQPS